MINEYVKDPDEFKSLTKGRVHWTIEKEPVVLTDMANGQKMRTGEQHITLSVSAVAKDGHVVFIKDYYGIAWVGGKNDTYAERLEKIKQDVAKEFPKATGGSWEYDKA